jgi:hypothetical protein
MSDSFNSRAFGEDTPRSGCLTVYLVLMLIANPLVALLYVALAFGNVNNVAPAPVMLLLACLGAVNTAAAVAIWMRYKFGLFLFVGSAAIGLLVNLFLGNFQGIGGGIIGPIILWYLVSQEWHTYK